MAYKTVSGAQSAEIELDGSVYTVNFGRSYKYYAARNDGSGTIYVSTTDKSCTPKNDGVVSIPSGGSYVHCNGYGGNSEIYFSGSGGAVVIAQDDPNNPFRKARKGGDRNAEPLVLLKATETECILSGGLTGFTILNEQDELSLVYFANEILGVDLGVKSLIFEKVGRFVNRFDSGIFATTEKIDLTNYNTITVDFYYLTNYSNNYVYNLGSPFFKLDLPMSIPQQNIVYDWSGWDNMHGYNRQYGKYYMDISKISGKHELCFGVQHGSYSNAYNNALVVNKIMLS